MILIGDTVHRMQQITPGLHRASDWPDRHAKEHDMGHLHTRKLASTGPGGTPTIL